ncbi:hypothetical protein LOC54_02575 [Acetobacter sp. AN02]|uniref:hypothetical protein n=1 Tax=Acetobacter sp. AN02 TaxID=2894186 RepID=UPI0024342B37|nr:hypothetical protein [Acetobacter sp. AN02]MDG6094008.1 hypothetical protein [Acetobacter sp. AN02]
MAESLRSLGLPRLAALVAVAVSVLAGLVVFSFHDFQGPMALLYRDLDAREAGQIVG